MEIKIVRKRNVLVVTQDSGIKEQQRRHALGCLKSLVARDVDPADELDDDEKALMFFLTSKYKRESSEYRREFLRKVVDMRGE